MVKPKAQCLVRPANMGTDSGGNNRDGILLWLHKTIKIKLNEMISYSLPVGHDCYVSKFIYDIYTLIRPLKFKTIRGYADGDFSELCS